MGKESNTDSDAEVIEKALFTIKYIGVFYCLASSGCLLCGLMTLWFAQTNLQFPFSAASGVWAGINTFVIFILGWRIVKHFSMTDPVHTRCQVIAYYTCTIMNLALSLLHIAYSAVGYQYCKQEIKDGEQHCPEYEIPRLMLMGGFSMVFGMVIFFLSLFGTIYISTGRRLKHLTGSHGTGCENFRGCELQNICCI